VRKLEEDDIVWFRFYHSPVSVASHQINPDYVTLVKDCCCQDSCSCEGHCENCCKDVSDISSD